MIRTALALMFGTSLAASAAATDGLEWKWDDTARRYLLRTDVELSEPMWVRSTVNRDSRIVGFAIDLVTTCRKLGDKGKKGWTVSCMTDDLTVRVDQAPAEPGIMDGFAKELDELYSGKEVQLDFRRDGRIRSVTIEGVDESNRRVDQIHEPFREMLKRAFAPLELRLPRKGDDGGEGSWSETGTMAMQFPSLTGTVGRADVTFTLGAPDGDVSPVTVSGQGVLGTGDMVTINGVDRPRNQYEMAIIGEAAFNRAGGYLVSQAYVTTAVGTASSTTSEGSNIGYVQRSEARSIPAAATVNLPESGERAPGNAISSE